MNNDMAIQVDGVTKIYKLYDRPRDRIVEALGFSKKKRGREHYALRDVSFSVKRGECVGIIGTNGAGKSTILKIITGVLSPTGGTITVNGRISALLELGTGFNMEYSGIENVYLNGSMIGFSKEEIDRKLPEILSFADIGDFATQPVKTYSSGMFVRLAFAVAINIDPEILIVDEALSVGDVFFQAKCFRKFEDFKRQGKTILFVSHDLSSIQKYCDRAILLNKGSKVAEGRPGTVIDLYKKVLVQQVEDHNAPVINENRQNAPVSWKANYVTNPVCQDYGDRLVEIVDYAVVDHEGTFSSTLIKGKPFDIRLRLRAKGNAPAPIAAFTIRDLKGTDLTGTNTMFEGKDIPPMAPGEERTVTFTQRMNLQGGQYLLSLGCTRFESDSFQVYHRLYDVISLSIISDKNTVGIYDMESTVSIE